MSSQSNLIRELYEASLESTVETLRALHQLKDDAGRRPRGGGEARPVEGASGEPADVLFDLTRLSLHHYNQLIALSSRYTDELVERLRELGRRQRGPGRPRAGQALVVRGRHGEEAVARFVVDNPLREPAEVYFGSTEFRHGRAGRPFEARVRFAPAEPRDGRDDRRLDPGANRTFEVAVRLDAPFAAGERYDGEVLVGMHGRPAHALPLEVHVDPAGDGVVHVSP